MARKRTRRLVANIAAFLLGGVVTVAGAYVWYVYIDDTYLIVYRDSLMELVARYQMCARDHAA